MRPTNGQAVTIETKRGTFTLRAAGGHVWIRVDSPGFWITPSDATCLANVLNHLSDEALVAGLPPARPKPGTNAAALDMLSDPYQ